ncbi:MAG: hypothetical protein CENE_01662 [Candidatus Celerinatantimonas neptuna]|nr:MAG: hypothetical protein CENE_01662 [Candidatus Celerinatantimonas neptuna]
MKRSFVLLASFTVFSHLAYAKPIHLDIDFHQLEKNIASCDPLTRKEPQRFINELKHQPVDQGTVSVDGQFMLENINDTVSKQCAAGLVQNTITILESYLKHVHHDPDPDVKNALAEAKMRKAATLKPALRAKLYQEADTLSRQYIAEKPIDEFGSPYYFASLSYLDAAEVTPGVDKLKLLKQAIAIAKEGQHAKVIKKVKLLLNEPIGISIADEAKFYKGKDNQKFKHLMSQTIPIFKTQYESGDMLAAYNISVTYSILHDAQNSEKWLDILAKHHGVDQQTCIQGVLADPDLSWLRITQKMWVGKYLYQHCRQYFPKNLSN